MKKQLFILLGCLSILLSSCLKEEDTNSTPTISFLSYPLTNNNDSLKIRIINGSYVLDTIEVGDTVFFELGFNSYYNNLTSFYLQQSIDSVGKILLPPVENLNTIFSSSLSDYEKGKFIFLSNLSAIYFPFEYVALKRSDEATLNFTLSSDADFKDGYGYNTVVFKLKTPIKRKNTIQQ
ncbi:MAG TPA: hypothetical protein PLE52_00730 [Paludibacteraceae bacterium]|nr:hypothetical protein [Paludibacteraceae bacterium]